MTNTEAVVAPLRRIVRGLLSLDIVDAQDRQVLQAIDDNASRLADVYSAVSNSPAAVITLSKEADVLYARASTVMAKYPADASQPQ
jgi:hypothetical protein